MMDMLLMISLDEKLDTCFAMGNDFDLFKDHTGTLSANGNSGTKKGKALFNRLKAGLKNGIAKHTCFGRLMIWSDGFLRNWGRQKENGFLILVVRICPPTGHLTSDDYTFCLAFGQSKLNHDRVIEFYSREVKTKIMPGKL